jgi:putative nucleotidyltransferase with HDIG domain
MVERRRPLDIDESLLKSLPKRRDRDESGVPGVRQPLWRGGRVDRVLLASVALAILIIVISALDTRTENWVAIVLLGIAFLVSEWFALPMKAGGRISLALFVVAIAMMHTGPLGVAVIPLFGLPIFYSERGEQGPRRIIYNAGQYVVSAGAAGLVFWHTGGDVLLKSGRAQLANVMNTNHGGKLILPWLLATIVFFVINTILVAPALASDEKEKITRFWERRLLAKFPGYLLYSGIGFLAAIAYSRFQFTAVVLIGVPLLGIRVVYTRYGMMRDVCDDTTLAVMEVVEGGRMFSEGHSVGVADISEAIADEMNFQDEDLHFLRQAALLHDIGLLALDSAIVDKPGALTPDEYEEIKKHPLIGARIVSREESLAVIAPTITHHHEMADGSGYVDGLTGETIPIGARILAVADAFDAMQRPVPYRDPLSAYAAAAEIIRAKGIMYDPEVVDAFVKVVVKRGLWTGALREPVAMPEGPRAAPIPPSVEPAAEQQTLEEAAPEIDETAQRARTGATPAEGIAYDEVRDEIEKDIREWERSDSERLRRRTRTEQRRRAGSLRRKKGQREKGTRPEA